MQEDILHSRTEEEPLVYRHARTLGRILVSNSSPQDKSNAYRALRAIRRLVLEGKLREKVDEILEETASILHPTGEQGRHLDEVVEDSH